MESIFNMIKTIVDSIVDDKESVTITSSEGEKGILFEIKAAAGDTGKLIGKGGRVATALRTLAKAAGAKNNVRVLVNVSKEPFKPTEQEPTEQEPAEQGPTEQGPTEQ